MIINYGNCKYFYDNNNYIYSHYRYTNYIFCDRIIQLLLTLYSSNNGTM